MARNERNSRRRAPRQPVNSFPSSRDLYEIGVCTIGGAAIGAALMYLFDPNAGKDRRHAITDAAGAALDSTTESLSSVVDRVRDGASHLGSHVSENVSEIAEQASDQATGVGHRLRDTFAQLSKSQLARLASVGSLASAKRRLAGKRSYMPGPATLTISGFGALAIGVTAMYFFNPFNPERSRQRRQYVLDRGKTAVCETGRLARATGDYLRNGAERALEQAHSYMPGHADVPSADQSLSEARTTERSDQATMI